MRGLSPFNVEKTPSFFVDDQKGTFTCYSSGEHGDHFDFLMLLKGVSLPEAIELLAADAGLELPKPDPETERRQRQAASLYDLLEGAATFFESQLAGAMGKHARDYLVSRGLTDTTIKHFRLGFAPQSLRPLESYLSARGFRLDQLIEAGLANHSQDGSSAYGIFRNRIIFPITDWRGRVIAFGGRALSPDDKAKYLNSPKTALFDKGQTLYNFQKAREAANQRHTDTPLVVAEGYMDVIAFHDAGVATAVAPLGTALTEMHLQALWRITDEPVLCFDGDKAGLKAAHAVCDRTLPLLTPGKSVWFCLLPSGQDPDDVLRSDGADALQRMLADRVSLVDMIWQREQAKKELTTPDRRAGFQQSLRELVNTIKDSTVKQHYAYEIKAKLAASMQTAALQPQSPPKFGVGRGPRQGPMMSGHDRSKGRYAGNLAFSRPSTTTALKNSPLAKASVPSSGRDELLVLTVLNHPKILDDHFDDFERLTFENPQLDRLQKEIITIAGLGESLDRLSLHDHLVKQGCSRIVRKLTAQPISSTHDFAKPETDIASAKSGWKDSLRLRLSEQAETERRSLENDLTEETTDENFARLLGFKAEQHRREHEFDQND